MCSSHSVSEGEASNFEVPPGCHHTGGSAYIEILSQSLLPAWTFSFSCLPDRYRCHSAVFIFVSEEIVSPVAVD